MDTSRIQIYSVGGCERRRNLYIVDTSDIITHVWTEENHKIEENRKQMKVVILKRNIWKANRK
jgi:hypothetical protein